MNQLLLFIFFTVPLVWSPGPVNILLAGLGANHGIRKNLPFVCGLICSAALISVVCLMGLQVFLQNENVQRWMVAVGSLYIMYLAVKLYRLTPHVAEQSMTAHGFRDGLLVTLLNPKFYVMVTAVFSQFAGRGDNAIFVCAGFIFILLFAHIVWLGLGATLREIVRDVRKLHVLNKIMGALLFGFSLYFLFNA